MEVELNLGEYFEIIIGPRLKARLSIKHNAKKKKKKKGQQSPLPAKRALKITTKIIFHHRIKKQKSSVASGRGRSRVAGHRRISTWDSVNLIHGRGGGRGHLHHGFIDY
jgi:hypothetical protein